MGILISMLDYRTEPLFALGLELGNHIDVFYLTDDSWTYQWLLKKVPKENILSLNLYNSESADHGKLDDTILKQFRRIHLRDRFLSKKLNDKEALKLFTSWYKKIEDFALKNGLNTLLIEGTPSHELIAEIFFNRNDKLVLVPDKYWKEKKYSFVYSKSDWSKLIKNNYNQNPYPSVSGISGRTIYPYQRLSAATILRFFKKRSSFNSPSRLDSVLKNLKSKIRPFFYSFDRPCFDDKYAVYFLHVEPEKSILNCGFQFDSQESLIWQIAYNLPLDTKLYVKEHPDNRGRFSLRKFYKIKKIKGVYFISKKVDTKKLILRSEKIYTISGTVALEASSLGKEAFSYGTKYFNMAGVKRIKYSKTLKSNVNMDINKFLFPFEISDSISVPNTLIKSNIQSMTRSIIAIVNDNNKEEYSIK